MSTLHSLIERLRHKNLVTSPELERAFYSANIRVFLDVPYDILAHEDIPLPFYTSADAVEVFPSPRMVSVLLQLLDVRRGSDVLVIGAAGAHLAALAYELSRGGRVALVERDARLAEAVRGILGMAGYGHVVRVTTALPRGEWSRILHLEPLLKVPQPLRRELSDTGILLHPRQTVEGYEFVKLLRYGEDFAEIAIRGTSPEAARTGASINLSSLLILEELLTNVWTGAATTPHDLHFRELVESTFKGGAWDLGRLREEEMERFRLAKKAFHLAYIFQMTGELDSAESLYMRSIEIYPTAEAHTFLGWTYSFMDRVEEAIQECQRAIEVDPTFGNPYNDIGAYLIQLGELDEAIPWLKKALQSQRYCCYFYAHCNLGRVYMMKGELEAAKEQFQDALVLNPDYELARELLKEVEKLLRSSGV